MSQTLYRKHFIPLESNPEVFTSLAHSLGLSFNVEFRDVLSLDEPELLPHPALAVVLILPTGSSYELCRGGKAAVMETLLEGAKEDGVLWFKQTINNACGLYAILHAVCNGSGRETGHICHGSFLSSLLEKCASSDVEDSQRFLEESDELETAYSTAAQAGDTVAPDNPEDEVDYHYVCFVPSSRTREVYELDGDQTGPVKMHTVLDPGEDMLSEKGVALIRDYIRKEQKEGVHFSLLALVEL